MKLRSHKSIPLCMAACLAIVVECAPAADGAGAESARLTAQKEALVRRVLDESPASKRIAASSNAEAKNAMAEARSLLQKAVALLGSGDVAGAEKLLNDAMRQIGKARQLVPDTVSRTSETRARYAELLTVVDSLRASFEKHLTRLRAVQSTGNNERAYNKALEDIENAKNYANVEQLRDATRAIASAEHQLLVGLTGMLGTNTLEYKQGFESQAAEYAFELDRNQSYEDLVPAALAEFKPSVDARRLISRYLDSNQTMREAAQQHAAKQNYAAALNSLRSGTQNLQRALGAAGLVVPSEIEKD
jgi:cellobiose-specific phosphotransferase system component IIA